MIDVLITVGMYYEESQLEQEAIPYKLPQIPKIGDIIIPDSKLAAEISRKEKLWNTCGCKINFVRNIAYYGSSVVVMLGGRPDLVTVDFVYDNVTVAAYVSAVPRVGEFVYVSKFDANNYLYVKQIAYSADNTIVQVFLSNDKRLPEVEIPGRVDVYVENDSVDVNVVNSVDVSNRVDVRIVDQYKTLDVRTRREAYD